MTYDEVLRVIIREAAVARSALCENELVIRLDTILELAQRGLDAQASPMAEDSEGG